MGGKVTCVAHFAVQAATAWPFPVALRSGDGQCDCSVPVEWNGKHGDVKLACLTRD